MTNNIEHIGIAVKDLEVAKSIYEKLLGTVCYKVEAVVNKIELLEASTPESPIAKFIEKRGEGIHHIAFAVEDIESEMVRLAAEGFTILSDKPKKGADNKLVCFVHPKSTNGVLIELCQEIK